MATGKLQINTFNETIGMPTENVKISVQNKENKVTGRRNPIETVKTRIKSPQSIVGKLEKKHLPFNFESMTKNLNDIAGIRVICPYISDIYKVRDILLKQPDISLIEEKETSERGICWIDTKDGQRIMLERLTPSER